MQPPLSPTPGGSALRAARLELDRALRERPCFSSAIQGRLPAPAYLDLITQLAWFLRAGARRRLTAESALYEDDLRAVTGRFGLPAPRPSVVLEVFSDLVEAGAFTLTQPVTHALCLALIGTSWTHLAARHLAARFEGATGLLGHLAREGERSLATVELAAREETEPGEIEGFLGLAQGAILGVALHLDAAWPACGGGESGACQRDQSSATVSS